MAIMNSKERKARNRGRKQGYIKAIDDFERKLISHLSDWKLSEAPFNDDETDRTRETICETIENAIGAVEEIAEQLKEGERMHSFSSSMQYITENYLKFLREENRRTSMPPKEYGMMLQKKKRKKRK